jgi:DNA-binding protein HU-beta
MNKNEFIDAVAAKAGLSKKDAKSAVDAVLETITIMPLNIKTIY